MGGSGADLPFPPQHSLPRRVTPIIIFGAAVRPDGSPSPALRRRVEAALRFGAGRGRGAPGNSGPARPPQPLIRAARRFIRFRRRFGNLKLKAGRAGGHLWVSP